MYIMDKDKYVCDFCGVELAWDERDESHGEMWGCEKCGKSFCTKCFTERHGYDQWMNMMQLCNEIYCPDCYEKMSKGELSK